MSDDLIKRLRDRTFLTGSWEGLAATRIEELEEDNKELTLQLLATSGQAADALDKLAKAVEALRVSLEGLNWAKAYLSTSGIDSVSVNNADAKVYATLVELEGKDHG